MEMFQLALWTLCCAIQGVLSQTDETEMRCEVSIHGDGNPGQSSALVAIKHQYQSNTNGQPYSDLKLTKSILLSGSESSDSLDLVDNDKNTHTLSIAFNGSHVCAAVNYLGESEACIEFGCHTDTPERECKQICFITDDFHTTHALDFFKTVKTSTGIGTWTTRDFLELKVNENVARQCFQLDTFYDKKFPEDVPKVTCPIGQRCRVSLAYVQATSNPRYYIGCEDKVGHIDGCERQGCQYDVREPIHGSSTYYKWHQLCRFCCNGDLCNDVVKCDEHSCDLSSNTSSGNSCVVWSSGAMFITLMHILFCTCISVFPTFVN